jgi:hypothetical protein
MPDDQVNDDQQVPDNSQGSVLPGDASSAPVEGGAQDSAAEPQAEVSPSPDVAPGGDMPAPEVTPPEAPTPPSPPEEPLPPSSPPVGPSEAV